MCADITTVTESNMRNVVNLTEPETFASYTDCCLVRLWDTGKNVKLNMDTSNTKNSEKILSDVTLYIISSTPNILATCRKGEYNHIIII